MQTKTIVNRAATFLGIGLPTLALVFSGRLVIDIGVRMLFPFIPQISAGLGLSVVGFSWLVFLRGLIGVAGPISGYFIDRVGRRRMMVLGLLCQAVGVAGLALTGHWWASLPMFLFGLALTIFLPAQQAYVSDQVAYARRGRAMATVEFSWASSSIFFLPVVGWLIDTGGWRLPFGLLSLVSLAAALLLWRYLPASTHLHHYPTGLSWVEVKAVFLRGNVLASVGVAFLLFTGAVIASTIWGIWLVADFGLDATTLGLVATGTGIAELVAAMSAGLFIDRLGKRRGSGLGFLGAIVMVLALPLARSHLATSLAVLVVMSAFIEFTIVSLIPLYSEQVPTARGTLFSLKLMGEAIGTAMSVPLTAILWEQAGLGVVCGVAAACLGLSASLMWKFLHEYAAPPAHLP